MAEVNTADINTAVQNILEGKEDFLALDFSSAQGREIALRCLNSKQLLCRRLSVSKPAQLEVLKQWVEQKHENILILNVEQRTKELVDIYLEKKFRKQLDDWARSEEKEPLEESVSIIHSYTKQQLICYDYETKKGEIVSYFDEPLGIPVKLKTEANVKLKLLDALKLVKKIDIELERVDLTITIDLINNIFVENLRAALLEIIDGDQVSYYDLPKHYGDIRELLAEKLQAAYTKCGLSVAELKIKDISLMNNIDEHLENQYFNLARTARVKEFEYKQEEQSLKLYEKKAKIHATYPDFQLGLTEAEKDLALERYLKRINNEKEAPMHVKRQQVIDPYHVDTGNETTVVIKKPQPPVEPKKSFKSRIVVGVLSAAIVVLAVVLGILVEPWYIPVAYGAAAAIAMICVGIGLRYQLRYGYTKAEKEAYENALKEYDNSMEEYNKQPSAKKAASAAKPAETPAKTVAAEPKHGEEQKQAAATTAEENE